jgi:hypothetical protein
MPCAVLLTADAARDLENIYQYIAVHDALFFRLLDPRHVGTVPCCRDCSPNSPKSGAFGDRALQPRCFGTVTNRSLQALQTCGGIGYCRDCSPL